LSEWILVIALSFIIVPFDMLRKLIITPLLPKQFIDNSWREIVSENDNSKISTQNNNNRTEILIPSPTHSENITAMDKRQTTNREVEVGEKKNV
jgi:hypothetical protein